MIINLLAFLLVLGILVMVHELGHFLAARFFHVRVDKFAFGFPPKIWSKKAGETEYTINLIPFGGYVSMYGEDGDGKKDPKSFTAKRAWQKAIILGAGVVMNLILAWLIFTCFYLFGGQAILPGMDQFKGVVNNEHVYVTQINPGSPAAQNGISVGDVIYSINGDVVHNNITVSNDIQIATAKDAKKPVTVVFEHKGQKIQKDMVTYVETVSGQHFQAIGITMAERGTTQAKWYLAPFVALLETGKIIWLTLVGIWSLISGIFTKFQISNEVGGPVAIYSYSGVFARLGLWAFAQFIAILSVSLALINILPFPALDGGHIAILSAEAITRKKIDDNVKQAINNAGFGLILLLMVALVYRDLANLGVFAKIKGIFK